MCFPVGLVLYCFNQHPHQPEGSEEDPHGEVSDEFEHNYSFIGIVHFIICDVISASL